ncbi:MAG: Gfo/Idh/MocA family protein [Candidatus Thorarchaeota archaeon]
MNPVTLIIVGAGDRGETYAGYALQHPDRAQIVGVAEPRDYHRMQMANAHSIPQRNVFKDWREVAERERFADAVLITTPDALHTDPAVAFANKGYHILLEKPMAPDEKGCKRIVQAALDNRVIFSVGHVLRYTRFTQKLKEILDSGAIGEIIDMHRLEPVGYWHQAHSFVRGNWRRADESSFMLLAKSCHDLDWIRYIIGKKCVKVSSFGSLIHFKKDNKPVNAAQRCLDCAHEPKCPYSAKRIYLGFIEQGKKGWPVSVVAPNPTKESLLIALREGPYGRCVYECDNDVVDHQIVNMEFEGGTTSSFTMTAFTRARQRETRIFGTLGEIYGDGTKIHVHDFLSNKTEVYDTSSEATALEGHGGGDYWLMHSFVSALLENNPDIILSGPEETLESHLMVFATERARVENRVVNMDEYIG